MEQTKRMYDAICSNCKGETQAPFKPDRKRTLYCQNCLRRHERIKMYRDKRRRGKERMYEEDEDYYDD